MEEKILYVSEDELWYSLEGYTEGTRPDTTEAFGHLHTPDGNRIGWTATIDNGDVLGYDLEGETVKFGPDEWFNLEPAFDEYFCKYVRWVEVVDDAFCDVWSDYEPYTAVCVK